MIPPVPPESWVAQQVASLKREEVTNKLTTVAMAVLVIFLILYGGCTLTQQQKARQVFQVIEGSCVVLQGVTDDPRLANLCLTQDELRVAFEAVLRARDAARAAASASAAPGGGVP